MNTLYGHDRILREYAQVKLPYILPGELEHGWTTRFLPGVDLAKASPAEKRKVHLVFNPRNYVQGRDHGYRVIPIGSPVNYMKPMASILRMRGDRSLLLMPGHSNAEHSFLSPADRFQEYLKEVQPLLTEFHPIMVCLYYHDFETPGVREVFEKAGMEHTSTLRRDDPLFLYHLRHLIMTYRYASSNQLATSLFYALYWGRIVFTLGRWVEVKDINCFPYHKSMTVPIGEIEEDENQFQATMYPELRWEGFDGRAHEEIGRFEIGEQYRGTPEELKEVLGWTPLKFRVPWANVAARQLPEIVKRPLRHLAPALVPLTLVSHFQGYIDPGSGSLVIQAVLGGIVAALVAIKVFWSQIKTFVAGLWQRKRQ